MSAQRSLPGDEVRDDELLDVDTSAAILRWMETALLPYGLGEEEWERWIDGGCRGRLEVNGQAITPAMLGCWAHSDALR
jgi:hypothetical protein